MKLTLKFHADDDNENVIYDAVCDEHARAQFEMTEREYESFLDKKENDVYDHLERWARACSSHTAS